MSLPLDASVADQVLAAGEERLALARTSLSTVPARLGALAQRASPSGAPLPGLSFDISSDAALNPPEAELLRTLAAVVPGLQSYGLPEVLAPAQAAALKAYQLFLEQLGRQLGQLAWAETAWNEELLARSLVAWTGDVRTGWRGRPQPERARAHSRALALAVASRLLWLQTAITILQGAAQISLRLALPGSAVLALPAVFNFVNQVAAQARRHAELTQS